MTVLDVMMNTLHFIISMYLIGLHNYFFSSLWMHLDIRLHKLFL